MLVHISATCQSLYLFLFDSLLHSSQHLFQGHSCPLISWSHISYLAKMHDIIQHQSLMFYISSFFEVGMKNNNSLYYYITFKFSIECADCVSYCKIFAWISIIGHGFLFYDLKFLQNTSTFTQMFSIYG